MLEPDRVAYSFTLPRELPEVEFKGPGRRGDNDLGRLCVLFVVFLLPILPSDDVSPSISLIVPKNGERDQGLFLLLRNCWEARLKVPERVEMYRMHQGTDAP